MATIGLGLVGYAVGGPFGAQIGVALGAYLDSRLLTPGPDFEKPEVGDFGLSGVSQGQPILIALGHYCRFETQYIWVSEVRELQGSQGGKHGGGQQSYIWNYQADLALALGEGPYTQQAPGSSLNRDGLIKVLADNQVIFNNEAPPVLQSNNFEIESVSVTVTFDPWDPQPTLTTYYWMVIHEGTSGLDLSVFPTGAEVGTSFMGTGPGGRNNSPTSAFTVLASGRQHPSTGKSYLKIRTPGGRYESTPFYGGTAVLGGAFDEASIYYWDPSVLARSAYDSLIFYPGLGQAAEDTVNQPIDTTIFSDANETPEFGHAFSGIAWIKIINLNLNPYGNRFPMFEVIASERVRSYRDSVARLFELASIGPGEYDVSGIDTNVQSGYVIRGPITIRDAISPLAVAREIVAQEDGDVVKLFEKKNAATVVIEDEDLGCAPHGEQRDIPVRFKNLSQQRIVSEVIVDFNNIDKDAQPDSVRAVYHNAPERVSARVALPLVMSRVEAQLIADRVLWNGILESKSVSIQLPFKYVRIGENTRIQFNAFGRTWTAMVEKVDRSSITGGIELEAVVESRLSIQTSDSVYSDPIELDSPDTPLAGLLFASPLDIPAIYEEQLDKPGIYLPATPFHGGNWQGGSLFGSFADAEDYRQLRTLPPAAKMGSSIDVLAPGPLNVWDMVNTVTIDTFGDIALESRTEDEVLAGANHGIIGGEIIAWQEATLNNDGTYTLSKLLRGLRNSDDRLNYHAIGDMFYQFDRLTCNFYPLTGINDIGSPIDFKFVTTNGFVEEADVVQVSPQGFNMRPFTPTEVTATEVSGGWDVEWEGVTRSFADDFGSALWSIWEEHEIYRIEIYSPDDLTSLITYFEVPEGDNSYTVTSAALLAAGVGASDNFVIAVRQLGKVGLSKMATIQISQSGTYTVTDVVGDMAEDEASVEIDITFSGAGDDMAEDEAAATITVDSPSSLILDAVSSGAKSAVVVAYSSARRLTEDYTGNLIRLRRDSDDEEQDFGYDGTSNELDTAAIATWIGSGDAYLVTLYDQSGNGNDLTQSTAASQVPFVVSGTIQTCGGKPAPYSTASDGSGVYLGITDSALSLGAADFAIWCVHERQSGETQPLFGAWFGDGNYVGWDASTNNLCACAIGGYAYPPRDPDSYLGTTGGTTDETKLILANFDVSTQIEAFVNGTSSFGTNALVDASDYDWRAAGIDAGYFPMKGPIAELIVFDGQLLDSTDRITMMTDGATFYS